MAACGLCRYMENSRTPRCRQSATPGPRGPPRFGESLLFRRLVTRSKPLVPAEPRSPAARPAVPDGVRIYAVGDLHGRRDLLEEIEERIAEDLAASPRVVRPFLVYLGDFVDRGMDSRGVLERLVVNPLFEGVPRVLLLGNHDLWMREFLRGQPIGASWLQFGGDATLASYGVRLDFTLPEPQRLALARDGLAERLPDTHRRLLAALELAWSCGDYFFCHAGIRPGLPLDRQSPEDLLWIREPFLSWRGNAGKVVVHGHTVSEDPVVRPNRIGIDTGAYLTGRLTCLVLEGTDVRFLATGEPATGPAGTL
ncbi:Bis(5'-nucleosyl)-tetraphosphatase, symmetrical [bacterium HR40]|nr:Bis(5'-nucleosyl)-tetraphosphatase, symmetrical [bacterium HR40]